MTRVHIPPDILSRIAEGDSMAFEELYRLTYRPVYAFLLSLTKNQEDANDLLQETYVQIYNNCHLYKEQGNPMSWIIKISHNLFLMNLRKKKNDPLTHAYELKDYDIPLDDITNSENRILIEQLFRCLSEEERNIVILHSIVGLKHREISKELDLPIGTVLSKYNRSIKKLNAAIKTEENISNNLSKNKETNTNHKSDNEETALPDIKETDTNHKLDDVEKRCQ